MVEVLRLVPASPHSGLSLLLFHLDLDFYLPTLSREVLGGEELQSCHASGEIDTSSSLHVGRIAFQAPGCLNVNIWLSDILLPDCGPPHRNGGKFWEEEE